jgi:ABC-type nitrate/sulfonate/bicarbonate transport system ATPase subunit
MGRRARLAENPGTLCRMPAAKPVIALDHVDKRFAGGLLALQGVSLQVHENEFVALLGASGCGKSTVLRLVAGLDGATAGRVDAPALAAPEAAETAFVFQDATLMPWASVFDNVWLRNTASTMLWVTNSTAMRCAARACHHVSRSALRR